MSYKTKIDIRTGIIYKVKVNEIKNLNNKEILEISNNNNLKLELKLNNKKINLLEEISIEKLKLIFNNLKFIKINDFDDRNDIKFNIIKLTDLIIFYEYILYLLNNFAKVNNNYLIDKINKNIDEIKKSSNLNNKYINKIKFKNIFIIKGYFNNEIFDNFLIEIFNEYYFNKVIFNLSKNKIIDKNLILNLTLNNINELKNEIEQLENELKEYSLRSMLGRYNLKLFEIKKNHLKELEEIENELKFLK
jgi:hypothetical protein